MTRVVSQEQDSIVAVVSYDDMFDELSQSKADCGPTEFDATIWHSSRREALGRAAALLESLKGETPATNKPRSGKTKSGKKRVPEVTLEGGALTLPVAPPAPRSPLHLVILDDTFEYRSMRREARRVARAAGCGLAIVWVDSDLEVCLARNAARPTHRRVPESSLKRIHLNLEPPSGEHRAARGGLIGVDQVSTNVIGSEPGESSRGRVAGGRVETPQSSTVFAPEEGAEVAVLRGAGPHDLSEVWAAATRAASRPLVGAPSTEEVAEAKARTEADRAATDASIVHRADLALRKIIAQAMKAAQHAVKEFSDGRVAPLAAPAVTGVATLEGGASEVEPNPPVEQPVLNSRELAAFLNGQRKLFLIELRLGSIQLAPTEGGAGEPSGEPSGAALQEDTPGLSPRFLRRCIAELKHAEPHSEAAKRGLESLLVPGS